MTIDNLPLEYARARIGARLATRPDEPLWAQLRAIQHTDALLDRLRSSAAAPLVRGIAPGADADSIELALRQALRAAIDEATGWVPAAWRAAVSFTRHLLNLPAIRHLLVEDPAAWMRADPELAPYAHASRLERPGLLREGPLRRLIVRAEHVRPRDGAHPLLAAWDEAWRESWPPLSAGERDALNALAAALRTQATQPDPGRDTLRVSLVRRARGDAGVAAVFAWLALEALDLERLRAAFTRRARPLTP